MTDKRDLLFAALGKLVAVSPEAIDLASDAEYYLTHWRIMNSVMEKLPELKRLLT